MLKFICSSWNCSKILFTLDRTHVHTPPLLCSLIKQFSSKWNYEVKHELSIFRARQCGLEIRWLLFSICEAMMSESVHHRFDVEIGARLDVNCTIENRYNSRFICHFISNLAGDLTLTRFLLVRFSQFRFRLTYFPSPPRPAFASIELDF